MKSNNREAHECLDHMSNEQLIKLLLDLPRRIVHNEDLEDLSRIILHELCHKNHLDLKKATYLIDNPQFGCMRGVAGFFKDECKHHKENMWEKPEEFGRDMQKAEFHNKMKCFEHASVCNQSDMGSCKELCKLGKNIGLQHPKVYTWDMRNGNRGVFLFEEDEHKDCDKNCTKKHAVLDKVAGVLGLCRLH